MAFVILAAWPVLRRAITRIATYAGISTDRTRIVHLPDTAVDHIGDIHVPLASNTLATHQRIGHSCPVRRLPKPRCPVAATVVMIPPHLFSVFGYSRIWYINIAGIVQRRLHRDFSTAPR